VVFSKKESAVKLDGCAIMVDTKKFEILDHFTLDLNIVPQIRTSKISEMLKHKKNLKSGIDETLAKLEQVENLDKLEYIEGSELNRLDYRNIALFAIIKRKNDPTSSPMLIANTHLIHNHRRGEVKFGQLLLILRTIMHFKENAQIKGNPNPLNTLDVMFTGDFNFIPNSFYYKMLSEKIFRFDLPLCEMSGQKVVTSPEVTKLSLKRQIEISSMKLNFDFYMNNRDDYFEEMEEIDFDGVIISRMLKEISMLEIRRDSEKNKIRVKRDYEFGKLKLGQSSAADKVWLTA
jgi:mRNA deadenylase 3'-5' endonuclease subunit Ccr4